MIITTNELRQLKNTPNSGYDKIKVEFLFHSNKLEGSTFTKENLEKYLKEQVIEGSHAVDDVFETINSIKLFDYAVDTLGQPLNETLLMDFNQMLMKNTRNQEWGFAGKWKKIPNHILGASEKLVLAQPHEVPARIEALLADWEQSEKSFEEVLKFHIDFEQIHPFQDGNGRIGRFIILKQCIENGLDVIAIDEKYNDEYKQGLYKAQTGNGDGQLREVFQLCQALLDEKLKFLENTLKCIRSKEA